MGSRMADAEYLELLLRFRRELDETILALGGALPEETTLHYEFGDEAEA